MKQLKDYINEACCLDDGYCFDPILREFNNLFSHTNVLLKRCQSGGYYLQGEMIAAAGPGITNDNRDGFLFGTSSINGVFPFDTPSKVTTLSGKTCPADFFRARGFEVCDPVGSCITDSHYKMNSDSLTPCATAGRDILYVVPLADLVPADED